MLYVPHRNTFGLRMGDYITTRPAGNFGITVTPGNNTMGTYVTLITAANMTEDAYGLWINFNSNSDPTFARDTLVDVSVDPAGSTAYSVLAGNLLASCATQLGVGIGISYYFPIWIKAGSQIGVRASVNNATVGTLRANAVAYGRPSNPAMMKCGSFVRTIGATAASSSGTAVTSGEAAEGAWTSLGVTADDLWFWQLGFGVNDGTMAALVYSADLGAGDASNKKLLIENMSIRTSASEVSTWDSSCFQQECEHPTKSGDTIYGRLQCSGTPDSALSLAAYGVGG